MYFLSSHYSQAVKTWLKTDEKTTCSIWIMILYREKSNYNKKTQTKLFYVKYLCDVNTHSGGKNLWISSNCIVSPLRKHNNRSSTIVSGLKSRKSKNLKVKIFKSNLLFTIFNNIFRQHVSKRIRGLRYRNLYGKIQISLLCIYFPVRCSGLHIYSPEVDRMCIVHCARVSS
jgi:hypothetical protein